MTDTTTIEIEVAQKDELDSLKDTNSESYKSVLQRLIDDYSNATGELDEARIRELAREEITDNVIGRALE
jgi:hypothetical protein